MEQLINLTISFTGKIVSGETAQTSDFSYIFILLALISVFAAAAIVYCLKNKHQIKYVLSSGLLVVFLVSASVFSVQAHAQENSQKAQSNDVTAENVDENAIAIDTTQIIADVAEDNSISLNSCTIFNNSEDVYIIKEAKVNILENAPYADEIINANISISTENGLIYNGPANGAPFIPTDNIGILENSYTTLFFSIQGIDNRDILNALIGNEIFSVDLLIDKKPPTTYTVTTNLNGGEVMFYAPEGWQINADGTYSKQFAKDTSKHDILSEWVYIPIHKAAMNFMFWNTDFDTLQNDTEITAIWIMKENLEDCSWWEIKTMANDISWYGWASEYYYIASHFAETSSTKKVTVNLPENAGTCDLYYRIIGINHDKKANGGTAGLTLMPINSIDQGFAYDWDSQNQLGATSWANSNIREELLQDGEIYNAIFNNSNPGLREVVSPVTKEYCNAYEKSSENFDTSISYSTDKLFLLSYKELGGISDDTSVLHQTNEGKPYEFISNDPWNGDATIWHQKDDSGKLLWPGPVLTNMNSYGLEWLLTEGKSNFDLPLMLAMINLSQVGGLAKNCDVNNYILERTISPENSWKIISLNAYGNPENYDAISYNQTACICPCFCL